MDRRRRRHRHGRHHRLRGRQARRRRLRRPAQGRRRRSPAARSSARSSRPSRSASSSRPSTARSSRRTTPSSTDPTLVNSDPFGAGWMIKVRFTELPDRRALRGRVRRPDGGVTRSMTDAFADRHIGTDSVAQLAMLDAVGYDTVDALDGCGGAVRHPGRARRSPSHDPAPRRPSARRSPSCACSPAQNRVAPVDDRPRLLRHAHAVGDPAERAREPELVHRVHAYQPEISQGRLEALINFQTMVTDLTGLATANASMLDEATAVVEGMLLARRASGSSSNVFLVDADAFPQTKALLAHRAEAVGIELHYTPFDADAAARRHRRVRRVRPVPGRVRRVWDPVRRRSRPSRRRAASPSSPPTCSRSRC